MICYIAICTEEYIPYYRELYKSLKQHSPNSKQTLYYIGNRFPEVFDEFHNKLCDVFCINGWYDECNSSYDRLERICSLRAKVVLNAFNNYGDKVVFCGAKIKFFSEPLELESSLDNYNAVVTPHITEPLPEDGKFPSNASVSFTGHISTDLVAFKNIPEVIDFLTWQDEIMKTQCKTTKNTYLDQSWLNFLPFFVRNVKILRNPEYNVAYWNYKQRFLRKNENNEWIVRNSSKDDYMFDRKLICFQFSGLDVNDPSAISRHQNRYTAEGDFLEFLKDYSEKIK